MKNSPAVFVQPRKARPFFGRHPWVYDTAIDRVEGKPQAGDVVRLLSSDREFIAWGLFNDQSKIRVRLFSWDKDRLIDDDLIRHRVEKAVQFRHGELKLNDPAGGCRLIFSEADGLSGLTVDRYRDVLSMQVTSRALLRYEPVILAELTRLLKPRAIVRRTERTMAELEGMDAGDAVVTGELGDGPLLVGENGIDYLVDVRSGQKTGLYLDQRDNRMALARYTTGRSMLDVFCYGGAFGLTALRHGGVTSLLGVDASGPAIALAQENARRNGLRAEFVMADAATYLEELSRAKRRFGVIVLDPPKFARTAGGLEKAVKGYDHINRLAIQLLEPGGILCTCSCSGHISATAFTEILVATAQKVNVELHLLEQRGAAPDHPVSAYCLDNAYLKCIIARRVPADPPADADTAH